MARNYAALPHEYLEEMDILSDAEFGRLCRALLKYSMTGEEVQLEGAEKVLLKRVFLQERRFQISYEQQVEAKRAAGKKGAKKRWHTVANDGRAIADDSTAVTSDSTTIADDSKSGKTETETKTKTDIPPSGDGRDTRENAVAAVMHAYMDKINPFLSERKRDELVGFVEVLGAGVCLRAIDEALDSKAANWYYIKSILESKQSQGVRCLADWDAMEEKRRRAQTAVPPKSWAELAQEMEGEAYDG